MPRQRKKPTGKKDSKSMKPPRRRGTVARSPGRTHHGATQRFSLTLELKDDPALIQEYRHWHMSEHIWPEIPKGIRTVGITDMEIYLLGTRLFMILEATKSFDFNRQMALLAGLPRQKEWEEFVSRFQKSDPGATSGEKWKMMERIFKLP